MKKLGFTLIELLAVILILGIIALIAIPTINNIIKESKRGAFKTSVQNIVKGIEEKCRIEQMKGQDITGSYTFDENGATPNLDVKGSLPTSGAINIDDECNVTVLGVTDDNYVVSKAKNSDDITIKDKEESNIKLVEAIMRDNKVGEDLVLPLTAPALATDKLFLKSQDDDGTTYYFRGNIDNNYVQFGKYKQEIYSYSLTYEGIVYKYYFADEASCITERNKESEGEKTNCSLLRDEEDAIKWRIVRINGDGTIRIVTEDSVGNSVYNESYDNAKYVGYTHDRSTAETNSTIKSYVDEWYNNNIGQFSNLDSLVATTKYCSDTSDAITVSLGIGYGFYNRTEYNASGHSNSHMPTYKCKETKETFGGLYNLKVGLLTADEFAFAGLFGWKQNGASNNFNQFLWNGGYFWSMSPYAMYTSNPAIVYIVAFDIYRIYTGSNEPIRPVINLIANTTILSGDGTKDKPYVINVG